MDPCLSIVEPRVFGLLLVIMMHLPHWIIWDIPSNKIQFIHRALQCIPYPSPLHQPELFISWFDWCPSVKFKTPSILFLNEVYESICLWTDAVFVARLSYGKMDVFIKHINRSRIQSIDYSKLFWLGMESQSPHSHHLIVYRRMCLCDKFPL